MRTLSCLALCAMLTGCAMKEEPSPAPAQPAEVAGTEAATDALRASVSGVWRSADAR